MFLMKLKLVVIYFLMMNVVINLNIILYVINLITTIKGLLLFLKNVLKEKSSSHVSAEWGGNGLDDDVTSSPVYTMQVTFLFSFLKRR